MGDLAKFLSFAPLRSGITILGVALGFFALTIMTSMAFHFHILAKRFERMVQGKLFIREESGFFGSGIISINSLQELSKIRGVKEVVPVLLGRLRKGEVYVFGLPELIVAFPVHQRKIFYDNIFLISGRWIDENNNYECVVGADIAKEFQVSVGKGILIKGKELTVTGILERTGSYEDKQVLIPFSLGEELFGKKGLASFIILLPENNVSLDYLVQEIKKINKNIEVLTPIQLSNSTQGAVILWDTLSIGIGVLAVIIGGLLIVVLMIINVMERIREIGIKRVLGASKLDIFKEFLMEAFWIGMGGGILGIVIGFMFIKFFGFWLEERGMVLFYLSPQVLGLLLIGAGFLGLAGGTIPAYIASGLKPLKALKGWK